ncbi:MAG: SDR family oxidoreductase [Elusimicrobiota bacterium]
MKILIVGASGFIGNALFNFLKSRLNYEIFGTYYSQKKDNKMLYLDITSPEEIERLLIEISPDFIIWAAGFKDVSGCEKNFEFAKKINFYPMENLLKIYKKLGFNSHIIYISTDYVFDGKRGFYKDTDLPCPTTFYGVSKFMAENILFDFKVDKFTILRTSAVMGRDGVFWGWLLDKIKNNEKIELYTNNFFTPTPLNFFNEIVLKVVEEKRYGIIHACGDRRISRYEFGLLLKTMVKSSIADIIPVENKTFFDYSLIQSDFCKDKWIFPLEEWLRKEMV